MLAWVQDSPYQKGSGCLDTVTVSFLIITSRNFLSQRGSCRGLFLSYQKIRLLGFKTSYPTLFAPDPETGSPVSLARSISLFNVPHDLAIRPLARWTVITHNAEGIFFCTSGRTYTAGQSFSVLEMVTVFSKWLHCTALLAPQYLGVPVSPYRQH